MCTRSVGSFASNNMLDGCCVRRSPHSQLQLGLEQNLVNDASNDRGDVSELELLQRVDVEALMKRGEVSTFAALWCDEAAARRMLVATEGDTDLAVKKIIDAMKWRDRKRQMLEGDCPLAIDVRCIGIDTKGYAIIYSCVANQILNAGPTTNNIIAEFERTLTLLDLIGHCGRFVIMLDMFGFSLWKNLNLVPILDLAAAMNSYFAERLELATVIDMPKVAEFIWGAMSKVLPPKTRAKVKFMGRAESLRTITERCGSPEGNIFRDVVLPVQDCMSLNRLEGMTWESRQATWDSTTWCGVGALGSVGSDPRCVQRLASLAAMESARAKRLKTSASRLDEMRTDGGKADALSSCPPFVRRVRLLCVLACSILLLVLWYVRF